MIRQGNNRLRDLLLAFTLTLLALSAQAAGVTVSNLADDGDALRFVGTVSQSGALMEVIEIDLDAFTALDGAGTGSVSGDTLFMTLTAPAGYTITSVSFSEGGTHSNTAGFSAATGSITIGGIPISLGAHIFGSTGGMPVSWSTGDLTMMLANVASVDVNIVNNLIAFLPIPGAGQFASVSKNFATLEVGLTAIPLPPAIWLMGAAVAALVSVKRRDQSA